MNAPATVAPDPKVLAVHMAEIARLRRAGVYEVADVGLPGMDYRSLASAEAVGDDVHYMFSGTFDEIVADVLDILSARCALDNRLKGYWPDGTDPKDALRLELYPDTLGKNLAEGLALNHSEFSEALDAVRTSSGGFDSKDDKLTDRSAYCVEIADAIIRSLDLTGAFDLRPGTVLVEKLNYNRNKRPYKWRPF